jgi:hypothetical protein
VPVTVTGRATDDLSGVSAVAFHVVDEYGRVQPSGMSAVQPDGTYSFTVRLQSRRTGQDKDGRHHTIDVVSRDLAGNVTMRSFVVTVPHDMGRKNGSNGGGQGGGGQKGEGGRPRHGPRGPRQELGRGHSRDVRVPGPGVTAVQRRTRRGRLKAPPDARGPEATPERASVSSDRRAQRSSRFVGLGEDLNREGTLFAGSVVRSAESCIRKAVAERGLTPGPAGLADTTAEDEAATGTAFAICRLNRWVRGASRAVC